MFQKTLPKLQQVFLIKQINPRLSRNRWEFQNTIKAVYKTKQTKQWLILS